MNGASLLVYDIPNNVVVNGLYRVLPRCGARVNLSCWIIPDTHLPVDLIEEMRSSGCRVHTVRFSEQEHDKVMALARESLAHEIKRVKHSFEDAILNAEKYVAEAGAHADENPEERRSRRRRAAYGRAKRSLAAAQEAAVAFGILGDVQALLDGIRFAVKAEFDLVMA